MKRKSFLIVIVFAFSLAVIGTVSAWPSHMLEFEKTDHGSCHAGTYTVSVGGILSATVTPGGTKSPGQQFSLTLDITGFTEAANKTVMIGISARLADNNEFFLGIQEDQGVYSAEGEEVGLDSSGDANNTVTLVLFAPAADGNYTLSVIAAEGGESFPTAHAFDYIELLIDVEVVTSTVSTNGIPGFNLFVILAVGLITGAPIVLIILRKGKKIRRG